MELLHSETNRGKKCVIYDGYTYRLSNILKNGDIVYRCSAVKTCKSSLTTDPKGLTIVKTKNAHTHEADDHKAETHQLRVRVRNNSGDISQRPSKVIRTELQKMDESLLNPKDLKNVAMSIYRERRKQFPKLPKTREEVQGALSELNNQTNKDENFTLVNNTDSGIVIFSCLLNLECLCNEMTNIFIDGTFKYCPKYFYQLYTIHGCKNGNYIPLVFALLPAKSEDCYTKMWDLLIASCRERNLVFQPEVVHIDFEYAMLSAILSKFPNSTISCCRFHLGQSWWRKIQTVGLSVEYKDRSSEIGKWLSQFFGLAFLPSNEIEECFVELMADAPQNDKCSKFADYILENYVTVNSKFPPTIWAAPPDPEAKRTTNGPESFHSKLNAQFYSCHPSVFIFLDVLLKIQTTSYIKMRTLHIQAPIRKHEKERIDFAVEAFGKYKSGELTLINFVKTIGYKYAARTDI